MHTSPQIPSFPSTWSLLGLGCKSRRVLRKCAGKCRVGYEISDWTVKLQTGREPHPDKT